MADGMLERVREAQTRAYRRAYGEPLETLNPARAAAFRDDAHWPFFDRLRKESPVHFTPDSNYGAFWSITKYHDIVAIDSNHGDFSSASGIVLPSKAAEAYTTDRPSAQSFITMDPPKHDVQRKTVSPALAPPALERMAPQIRERAGFILDSLPIGEPFDWVDLVSKELTTMTLATLFDFPFDQRRKLTFWSDAMT
jgi:cytochrome P450